MILASRHSNGSRFIPSVILPIDYLNNKSSKHGNREKDKGSNYQKGGREGLGAEMSPALVLHLTTELSR